MHRNQHCWSVHPQPLPDELFSSWIMRAAIANGQKLFTLLYLEAPHNGFFSRNIDNDLPDSFIKKISHRMRTPLPIIRMCLLNSYESIVFELSTKKVKRKLCILHTGAMNHTNERFYQQYCPKCFQDQEPYYRKLWRLAFITVCSKHHCRLLDRCPNCKAPIQPLLNQSRHQHHAFKGKFTQCHNCNFDLKNGKVEPADQSIISDTQKYENIINVGYIEIEKNRWIYSFSLFSVLRHMMRCTLDLKDSLMSEHSIIEIENLPIDIRYSALIQLSGIFDNWPFQFIAYCKDKNILYYKLAEISKANNFIPFWFLTIIQRYFYKPNIPPSKKSIHSAIQYMKKNNLKLNMTTLNKLMGYKDSSVIYNTYKKTT